jgi:hypothetical protein
LVGKLTSIGIKAKEILTFPNSTNKDSEGKPLQFRETPGIILFFNTADLEKGGFKNYYTQYFTGPPLTEISNTVVDEEIINNAIRRSCSLQ